MANITNILGNAPQEQVTVGSEGRASEVDRSGEFLSQAIGTIVGVGAKAFDAFSDRKEKEAEEEQKRKDVEVAGQFAKDITQIDSILTQEDSEALDAAKSQEERLASGLSQNPKNSRAINRARVSAYIDAVNKSPHLEKELSEIFRRTGASSESLMKQLEEDEKKRTQGFDSSVEAARKALQESGYVLEAAAEDPMTVINNYNATVGEALRIQKQNERKIAVIESDDKLSELEKSQQRKAIIPDQLVLATNELGAVYKKALTLPPQERMAFFIAETTDTEREAVANIYGASSVDSATIQKDMGVYFTMKKGFEDVLKATGPEATLKMSEDELKALETKNKIITERAKAGLLEKNPALIDGIVMFETVPPEVFNILGKTVTEKYFGPLSKAIVGVSETLDTNKPGGVARPLEINNPKDVIDFMSQINRSLDETITSPAQVTGVVSDFVAGVATQALYTDDRMKGVSTLTPTFEMLAREEIMPAFKNLKFGPDLSRKTVEKTSLYYQFVTETAQKNNLLYEFGMDKEGLPVFKATGQNTRGVAAYQSMVRNAVKARAHAMGGKDYRQATIDLMAPKAGEK